MLNMTSHQLADQLKVGSGATCSTPVVPATSTLRHAVSMPAAAGHLCIAQCVPHALRLPAFYLVAVLFFIAAIARRTFGSFLLQLSTSMLRHPSNICRTLALRDNAFHSQGTLHAVSGRRLRPAPHAGLWLWHVW